MNNIPIIGENVNEIDLVRLLQEQACEAHIPVIETEICVSFKKMHESAVIPKFSTPSSSGFDLVSIEDCYLVPGVITPVRTGLCVQLPNPDETYPFTFEMQIRPRSGLARKFGVTMPNTPCTIDNDYRGELIIPMTVVKYNLNQCTYFNENEQTIHFGISQDGYQIKAGDRIAQGVICPVLSSNVLKITEVNELDDTERGDGGFGSTGK